MTSSEDIHDFHDPDFYILELLDESTNNSWAVVYYHTEALELIPIEVKHFFSDFQFRDYTLANMIHVVNGSETTLKSWRRSRVRHNQATEWVFNR